MRMKSLKANILIILCIISALSVNVMASGELKYHVTKEIMDALKESNKLVEIGNKDLGGYRGFADIVSIDEDGIEFKAVNVRREDSMFCCKDIVTWRVKEAKITDVSLKQTKQGFLLNNSGIKKITAASSDTMCTIVAKHNFILGGMLKFVNIDSQYDFSDYWTIFSDGRYYIKRGDQA